MTNYMLSISDVHLIQINEKEEKKICHANANHKKARATVIILDKIESRTKSITGDRKGHSITVKEPFHQEDKIICVGTYKLEPLNT